MAVRDLMWLVRVLSTFRIALIQRLITEVAFVGKAPGTYSMLLGGGYYGQRLNKIFRGGFICPPH